MLKMIHIWLFVAGRSDVVCADCGGLVVVSVEEKAVDFGRAKEGKRAMAWMSVCDGVV